ncbi:unnamed protein product [Commensalibacter communis]|uniref:Uncharacterized protein n=1 Tax=Commensalibacter communis TaxID=2972786 RepID=A0A9W4TRE4_9PROT|nr:hypothetical protein [Commensalibacter communis]CAI3958047.1 unnamed protein product [Commensalibacter communis]CAI3960109.1 unnamed protein product [Commensalibacter communis]
MLKAINLGVINFSYSDGAHQTTGNVAGILEKKYEILTNFVQAHEDEIAKLLTTAMENVVKEHIQTGKVNKSSFNTAFSKIGNEMKRFLSTQEVEKMGIAGVPTKAASDGVSHRFKRKRKGVARGKTRYRARRPSFIDTGQMESSYIVWGDFK